MDDNVEPVEKTTSKRSKIKIVAAALATGVVIYAASFIAVKAASKTTVPSPQG